MNDKLKKIVTPVTVDLSKLTHVQLQEHFRDKASRKKLLAKMHLLRLTAVSVYAANMLGPKDGKWLFEALKKRSKHRDGHEADQFSPLNEEALVELLEKVENLSAQERKKVIKEAIYKFVQQGVVIPSAS